MTQSTAEDSGYEPAEIERIVREWFRSYSEKDFDTHNALIHPDAVVVYPEMCFVDPDLSAGKDFLEKTLEKDEANFVDLSQRVGNRVGQLVELVAADSHSTALYFLASSVLTFLNISAYCAPLLRISSE